MNADFFRELNELAHRHSAGDAKFRGTGEIRIWLATVACAASLVAFGKSALVFGVIAGGACIMALTWIMAELASKAFRLALPSGIILAGFVAGSFFAGLGVSEQLIGLSAAKTVILRPSLDSHRALAAAGGLIMTALTTTVFYLRFRVPLAVAIAAVLIFFGTICLLAVFATDWVDHWFAFIALIFSVLTLSLAIRFDLSDPTRRTRRSDVAFWLYLLSAGLIICPIFWGFVGEIGELGSLKAFAIVVAVTILGVIALVVDRRALIVSTLSYAGIAITYLITQDVSVSLGLQLALLGLALVVLTLLASWRRLRGALLPHLPLGDLRERLPPIDVRPA